MPGFVRPNFLAVFLCLVGEAMGATSNGTVTFERLRAQATPPEVNIQIGFEMTPGGLMDNNDTKEPDQAIAELEESLKAEPRQSQLHIRLGHLFSKKGDTNSSDRSFKQALEVSRRQVDVNPDDDHSQAAFAAALAANDQSAEALHVLRKAVGKSDHAWRCWLELGHQYADIAQNVSKSNSPTILPGVPLHELRAEAQKSYKKALEEAHPEG